MLALDADRQSALLIFGFGVHGLFVNAVQSTLYALCAYIYPTSVRATGTASALAFGRLGAILSAFAGAGVISLSGAQGYLILLGTVMLLALLALTQVRRHIPVAWGRQVPAGGADGRAGERLLATGVREEER